MDSNQINSGKCLPPTNNEHGTSPDSSSNASLLHNNPNPDPFISSPPLPPFPLRTLPEELQLQIISFLIPPTWSIRASCPIRSARSPASSTNPFFYGLRQSPQTPTTLHLIDKRMSHQVCLCSAKKFSGELYLASVLDAESALAVYYQYGLGERVEPRGSLDGFRDKIAVVHVGCYQYMADSRGFDVSLLGVLKNLRVVVAHSENRLHENSLYGWGDAEHLIRVISDASLVRCVQRRPRFVGASAMVPSPPNSESEGEGMLRQLWERGITTLHEMKVNMGSGEMMVSFMVVFWIREGVDTVVLGKYSVREWFGMGSEGLRRTVYERAVDGLAI